MNILFLTILIPLIGFLLLAGSQGRWSEKTSAIIGVSSIGIAAFVALLAIIDFYSVQAVKDVHEIPLWTWMSVGHFEIDFTLYIDGLSLTMLSVVVGVGFLIHLYASWYMRGEEGFSRFFAYTNLFIASMVVLVLSDNLLAMYLGWEGVGLCSYLLIGFYYKNSKNGAAAMKAFIITRIGDVFLAIGLFILYNELGTLNIRELLTLAPQQLPQDSSVVYWATLMLLGGAVGKSAQLPLQTWLADAMAGPTPVSALIHAATMVTAGVYLIARMNGLFVLSTDVLSLVAVIGVITLIVAGFSALVQTDIKRVLAYSTMSQLGYMFLALGVQAWDAAIFHLMTHAFFKALLFLASGSVILACHHEQNIMKMGGLYKKIPLVYASFIVGGAALSALPFITAGFYSKDAILWGAYAHGYKTLAVMGILGAFLTSLYTFRLILLVFHGEEKIKAERVGGLNHNIPLVVLIVLSTAVGALITPPLASVFPTLYLPHDGKLVIELLSALVALLGVGAAIMLYGHQRKVVSDISKSPIGRSLSNFWFHAWGFDWLYDRVFVKPYLAVAKALQNDPISRLIDSSKWLAHFVGDALSISESGYFRWYVTSVTAGAAVVLTLLLLV